MRAEIAFNIRAALSDDLNEGWVWVQTPSNRSLDSQLEPRCVAQICRRSPRRSVYVEVRKIDQNFRKKYNHNPRIRISDQQDTLVVAEWYRDALGIRKTTQSDNQTGTVRLTVKRCNGGIWPSIRAACHHPDITVRLGTRLGLCGAWLGLVGASLGLLSMNVLACFPYRDEIMLGVVVVLAIVGLLASRGPTR